MTGVLPTLIIVVFGWFLSGTIHELGHLIAGKFAGLKIDTIKPLGFSVHVSFSGRTTNLWYALISISGPLFTVVVGIMGVIAIVLLKDKWFPIRYAVWIFLPMMVQSLMLFGVPLAAAIGAKMPNDDVTKFLQQTGWHPLVVSLIGLMLLVLCVAVLTWALK